ncbi:MAG TPA: DUF2834 domain-containing protein [Blastocatellia bacterium]|nr:DUF2834 domain-containing protein [Blastocatellia bacterium]
MKKNIYLILAIAGLVLPYYYLVQFIAASGLNPGVFVEQLFATKISCFFAADLLIACAVFVCYLRREAARLAMGKWWLYLAAMLLAGLSFALPLFLYARESKMEEA